MSSPFGYGVLRPIRCSLQRFPMRTIIRLKLQQRL